MIVIVPANNKGGVGKTKISILLAEYFSHVKKKRVLAIDFDAQCNFSQRFINMEIDPTSPQGKYPPTHPDYDPNDPADEGWDGRSSIADIFFGGPLVPYPTHIESLDILPAHASQLLLAEDKRPAEITEKIHFRLHQLLWESDNISDNYDIVIIDTAPSKGPLTIAAIKAATHLIIPSVMEEQPINGIYGMIQLWMQESLDRTENFPLDLIGILPNLYRQQTTLHKDMLEGLKENPNLRNYIMPCILGQRTVFAEVDSEQASPRSIFDFPVSNKARNEALTMCEIVEQKVAHYGA